MTLKILVRGIPVQVVWFNEAFLKNKLQAGKTIVVSGKWDRHRLQLTADRTFISGSEIEKYAGRFEPVSRSVEK